METRPYWSRGSASKVMVGRTLQLGTGKRLRNAASEWEEVVEIGIQQVGVESIWDIGS